MALWVGGGLNAAKRPARATFQRCMTAADTADAPWEQGHLLPGAALAGAAVVSLADGSLVLIGGRTATAPLGLTTTHSLPAGASQWNSSALPDLNNPRVMFSASSVENNTSIVVVGGMGAPATAEVLRADTPGSWTPLAATTARYAHGAAASSQATPSLLVVGGCDARGQVLPGPRCCEQLDVVSGQWREAPSLPTPRAELSCAMARDDVAIVCGGGQSVRSVHAIDVRRGESAWRALAELPRGVRCATAVTLGGGARIAVIGGAISATEVVPCCQLYDVSADKWQNDKSWELPEALQLVAAAERPPSEPM